MQKIIYSLIAISISILPFALSSDEEVDRGGIEEITVTAEKRTSLTLRRGTSVGKRMNAALVTLAPGSNTNARSHRRVLT